MNKREMVERLAEILEPTNANERARLSAHHMKRSTKDVRISLERWMAVEEIRESEIRENCQFEGLPNVWR